MHYQWGHCMNSCRCTRDRGSFGSCWQYHCPELDFQTIAFVRVEDVQMCAYDVKEEKKTQANFECEINCLFLSNFHNNALWPISTTRIFCSFTTKSCKTIEPVSGYCNVCARAHKCFSSWWIELDPAFDLLLLRCMITLSVKSESSVAFCVLLYRYFACWSTPLGIPKMEGVFLDTDKLIDELPGCHT